MKSKILKRLTPFLVVVIMMLGAVSVSASELPPIPDTGMNQEYLIYKVLNKDEVYLHLVYNSGEFSLVGHVANSSVHDGGLVLSLSQTINGYNSETRTYQLVDGSWVKTSERAINGNTTYKIIEPAESIISSSYDFYDSEGNLVFQRPLTLAETVAEEIAEMMDQTMETISILVLCGVGLMVLLMGLMLFGKVFSIYRVR